MFEILGKYLRVGEEDKLIFNSESTTFPDYSIRFWHWRFLSQFVRNHTVLKTTKKYRMVLDLRDQGFSRVMFIFGVIEPFETEIFEKTLKRGNVILDIGANLGYYALIAANVVGCEGKVFAFEPEPNNFSLLKRNIEINGLRNVVLLNKAVSDKPGKAKLFLSKERKVFGGHSLYNNSWLNAKDHVVVDTISLDEVFKNYENKKVDVIKMDVEGAEGKVLQGMEELLKENKDIRIFTEFSPLGLQASTVGPKGYVEMLMSFGFRLYEINEEKRKLVPINSDALLRELMDKIQTNLLCTRDSFS